MKIHPTAIVDATAEIADDVEIGPYCLVEGDVKIGPGCVLRSHAIVRRYTTMGRNNVVDSFAVLGGLPQDYKFDAASKTYLRIGDDNVFREGVTLSRATGEGNATTVGSHTYWMTDSHAGHNATVEDSAILVNGAAVAGHSTIGRKAILSAHAVVHQFCWVGEGAIMQGNSGASSHIPPYVLVTRINEVISLNVVGLRRSKDVTAEQREQIKEAFRMLYRGGLTTPKALEQMEACTDWSGPAATFRDFIRRVVQAKPPYDRPLCQRGSWSGDKH